MYCLLIYLVAPKGDGAQGSYADLPYLLTYTSNWFVGNSGMFAFTWSLAAEEQFYSTWPPAVRCLGPARAVWLLGALLAAVIAWNIFAPSEAGAGNLGLVMFKSVQMAICWGCLAAFALHSRKGFALLWRFVGHRWTSAVLLCLNVAILGAFQKPTVISHYLFAALVASCIIREDNILASALAQPWAVHTGAISYGMYMMHGLVYLALDKIGPHVPGSWDARSVSGFFVALAVTIGVATLSFRYYESLFLRMKSRFAV